MWCGHTNTIYCLNTDEGDCVGGKSSTDKQEARNNQPAGECIFCKGDIVNVVELSRHAWNETYLGYKCRWFCRSDNWRLGRVLIWKVSEGRTISRKAEAVRLKELIIHVKSFSGMCKSRATDGIAGNMAETLNIAGNSVRQNMKRCTWRLADEYRSGTISFTSGGTWEEIALSDIGWSKSGSNQCRRKPAVRLVTPRHSEEHISRILCFLNEIKSQHREILWLRLHTFAEGNQTAVPRSRDPTFMLFRNSTSINYHDIASHLLSYAQNVLSRCHCSPCSVRTGRVTVEPKS